MADNSHSERRLKLFIYARILVSFLFIVSTYIVKFKDVIAEIERYQSGVTRLMAFSFVFSVLSLWVLSKHKYTLFLTYLQVIWDLLFVTIFVLFTGGILSPYSFFYILSIMIAGMLLGQREALYTASLCWILYGAILDFQYFGFLSFIGLSQDDAHQYGASRLLYTMSFNLIAFALTAFITGLLAERAQLSEEALQQTEIDYSELTQLSSAIVAHSESGILTTTVAGRIRVFNPYAETAVGVRQSDVYDKHISTVFRNFPALGEENATPHSGEFEYQLEDGRTTILGYRLAPFTDRNGYLSGYIVNFRDITELRRMESALKKADRLAALGELSARMAHEIRNPLASLGGAVQLLSASLEVKESDRRLLAIVSREAERLDLLITEFLLYARPTVPKMQQLTLVQFIDEIILLIQNDPRFKTVAINSTIAPHIVITADPDQLRQVIINLLHNAADALPYGGSILVEALSTTSTVSISITDDGIGISDDSLQHLFEPFWTTKPSGTGLGLAICYRIIQAHGGVLTVDSIHNEGSRFTIALPQSIS